MEDSDSSDNENDTLVKHRRQRERLAREEAFYRFVNSLSNEDYKLMRDNNLLGAIGEKTEEELQRSLQRIKESIQIPGFYPNYFMPTIQPRTFNPPGGRHPIHDVQHSVGSVTNQVSSFFRQPEPMTGREQRVNRSCTATSENNLNTSDTELRMNSYLRIQRQAANTQSDSIISRPSRAEASASETSTEVQPPASQEIESNISTIIRKVRARPPSSSSSYSQNEILWRVHNPENIQKQTRTETDVTFPGSQLNTTISSMNTPGTSGQRRERNRSPELQRVRARNEESSPSNSQSQIQRKVHNTGKTYRRTANSQSETTSVRPSTSEVTAAETSMDILPSRIQRRTRSTSPVHRRVKPRIEGNSESSLIASYSSDESSSTESSLSNSSLETREESRPITPTSDDFNFSPIEDHLEENEDSPPMGGLSKRQIDMLPVRNFNESDASNSCTICIEEFRQGNKIRTLPCSHTYHVHCIDSWLADNATCPVCRRRVRSDGREL
ncbi:E3 ubiquitin-protein ligase RLIM-like [Dipodomys merriami]|uniref:E3 ubiquitin-protein ligase RLIM-like n=1 Tax=Dipodomys merriami TaxID=94247 RepID=UPI003855849F